MFVFVLACVGFGFLATVSVAVIVAILEKR